MADQGAIELEHSIGYSAEFIRSISFHPNKRNFIYITGSCVVLCDLEDKHGQVFLRGHDDDVTCASISPSGALIASGQRGYNADVIVWDLETRSPRFRFMEHDHEIECLDFSHDERLLCTCGVTADAKMFIWDLMTGCIVSSVGMNPNPTLIVKFGGFRKDVKGRPVDRYQFATAGNKKVIMWSLNPFTGELENEALNIGSAVRDFQAIDFSPQGERLFYVGTTTGDFMIFQMKNHHRICTQMACSQGIMTLLALSEEYFLLGGGDGTLSMWQIQGGQAFEMSKVNLVGGISGLSASLDFSELLVGTTLGFQYRIRTSDFQYIVISENHTRPMTYITFPKNISDKFATSSEDGTIRIWDGSDYSVISRCSMNSLIPNCFVLTLEIVISGWNDGKIRAFRADNGGQLWTIDNAHRLGVSALELSHNQRFFCTGGDEGEVRVWEIRTRDMVSHLKEHTSKITSLQLMYDDVHLVTVSRDKSMLTWDLKSDKRIASQTQRIGGINTLDVTRDSNIVLTAGQEKKINKWDLRQTQPITSIDAGPMPDSDEIMALAVSHDGRYFASGGTKEVIRIWDVQNFQLVAEGHGHSDVVSCIAWAYDNKQIISTGRDNCTMIWNVFL